MKIWDLLILHYGRIACDHLGAHVKIGKKERMLSGVVSVVRPVLDHRSLQHGSESIPPESSASPLCLHKRALAPSCFS